VLFAEPLIRPLLVCHTIAAAVLVGASTHHLLWCRHYLRQRYGRIVAEKRFATIAATCFVITFVLGNCLYPTYKVRVRAEYFDNPAAVAAEVRMRAEQRHAVTGSDAPTTPMVTSLATVSHVFDIKEHWVALGLAASLALWLLSRRAHPREYPQLLPLYLGLALFQCSSAWLGAIIGVVTASFRSVGGPT
jgi:hypothetical protein